MKINSRGYWENNTDEGHGVDPNLANGLKAFFAEESEKLYVKELYIVDVGCGTGYYTKELNNFSSKLFCQGYDGNPNTKEIAGDEFGIADFSQPGLVHDIWTDLLDPDWVLCLEVGEHIPAQFEQTFIDNICSMADYGIVLSWAIVGQGGDGHVNCRNNDYIISEMSKRSFDFDKESTDWLRNTASRYPMTGHWFKNTLMVFRRRSQHA